MATKKKPSYDWNRVGIAIFAIVFLFGAGFAAGYDALRLYPKAQCAEIIVTGTPGSSTMAMEGNDLYLTGVTQVRCGQYIPPEPPKKVLNFAVSGTAR